MTLSPRFMLETLINRLGHYKHNIWKLQELTGFKEAHYTSIYELIDKISEELQLLLIEDNNKDITRVKGK